MSSDNEDTTSSSESEQSDSGKDTLEFIEKLSDVPMGKLPTHVDFQRTRVDCRADAPVHVHIDTSFPVHFSVRVF